MRHYGEHADGSREGGVVKREEGVVKGVARVEGKGRELQHNP